MVVETRDSKSGIIRFEINTVAPDACRAEIESSGFEYLKDGVADTVRYCVKFKGFEIQVTSTPTRTVMFGTSRYAMLEFLRAISGDERRGTAWEYDDSKRTDYSK